MTAWPPAVRFTLTGRASTVMSGLMTKMYCPCCPVFTAAAGTTIAFEANQGMLLIANAGGNNGGCRGDNANVTLLYSYDVWRPG